MSVKIIGGYLKLLNRVLQHYRIDLSISNVSMSNLSMSDLSTSELRISKLPISKIDLNIWQQFQYALQQPTIEPFDANTYVLILEAAQQYFQRPIGLVIAEHATLQDFGLLGYLASTSLDLKQALILFEQYYELLYEQTNLEKLVVETQHDRMIMTWHAPFAQWQMFYELNLALIYKITDSIVQDELIPPNYMTLGYPVKWALYHYERFFNTRIQIVAHQYAICFSVDNLKVRNIAADEELNQVLSHQAQHSLHFNQATELQAQQFKYKIIQLIEKAWSQDKNLQWYVAQQLHCSERTLQRQLKSHGLNFQVIVDEYRLEKSQAYLRQGKRFSEIAERLNYADQSAFSRAFKRWSGLTPTQYMKNNGIKSSMVESSCITNNAIKSSFTKEISIKK